MKNEIVMRIVFALLLVCALLGCSAGERANQDIPSTPFTAENIRIEPTQSPRSRSRENRTFPYLDDISKRYGMVPLRISRINSDDYEIRIWSTIGLGIERCFILNRKNNVWNSTLITPMLADGELVENTKGKLKVLENKLGSGNLEHDKLNQFVTSKSLVPPLPHELDSLPSLPIMDEGLIAIEVKNGDSYDVVSYRGFSESNGANEVVQVCKQFEIWFKVTIGCAH